MEYLQIWMLVVSALRLLGAGCAFFYPVSIREKVYSRDQKSVTGLFLRLFGTWTLMSMTICLLIANDPHNRSLLLAGFVSFVLALGHFFYELFVTGACSVNNILAQLFVAGTSIVWLGSILF